MKPDYETDTLLYTLLLPFMWIQTTIAKYTGNPLLFGPISKQVRETATTWKAMALIYDYEGGNFFDDIYLNCLNGQALRNRLRLEKKILSDCIDGRYPVEIHSLACGGGDAVLGAMKEANETLVLSTMVDSNCKAINAVVSHASKLGVLDCVRTRVATIREYLASVENPRAHPIFEMVGVLEYTADGNAISLLKMVFGAMPHGSILITSNIHPNRESEFLKYVVNWPMVYRTESEFRRIIRAVGFTDTEITYEPLHIHGVAVARKV